MNNNRVSHPRFDTARDKGLLTMRATQTLPLLAVLLVRFAFFVSVEMSMHTAVEVTAYKVLDTSWKMIGREVFRWKKLSRDDWHMIST